MKIEQLCKYFDRKEITIRKAIRKMCDNGFSKYKYLDNNKVVCCCVNDVKQNYIKI